MLDDVNRYEWLLGEIKRLEAECLRPLRRRAAKKQLISVFEELEDLHLKMYKESYGSDWESGDQREGSEDEGVV